MDTVMFISTADTCRGPMAAALFNNIMIEKPKDFIADSAGLFTKEGIEPSDYAVKALKELGADITAHKSSMLTFELGEHAKYLICLTAAHRERILQIHPEWAKKTMLLSTNDISDPFGETYEIYKKTADEILSSLERMLCKGNFNAS